MLGTAKLNLPYPSVNVAFPGYPSGDNSGFSCALDTTKLPNGTQNLTVVATGINGSSTTWPLTVTTRNQGIVSDALVSFLTCYEGFSATPYGGIDYWNQTIGYGHVILPGESFTSLTKTEGLALFKRDLVGYEESTNNEFGNILKQNEFDALVSFCFNLGKGVWSHANLTDDVKSGATDDRLKTDFTNWKNITDPITGQLVFVQGLLNRRLDEWEMFVYGDYVRSHYETKPL